MNAPVPIDHLQPADARRRLLDELFAAFDAAGVAAFAIKPVEPGAVVGVLPEHRAAALRALVGLAGPGMRLRESYPTTVGVQQTVPLTDATVAAVPRRCPAVHVARFWSVAGDALQYGFEQGVRIEFWADSPDEPDTVVAPIPNAAAQATHRSYLTPATIDVDGRPRPSVALFARTFLDEIDFPVDAVYTWVDGDDPSWRERMGRARAAEEGREYHPVAHAEHRFANRDELRYSLRSLETYAPWIRTVHLVTDGQAPAWLDPDGRVRVVDHREIFADPAVLPVFNSNAIISQLHHIDGLAEHYLYLNDDIFFGREVQPQTFWHGNGLAKVFPTPLTRSFGPAHAGDLPHLNITRNIRAALEATVGRSVSTAIMHTPYPQLRSVNYEIEERFGDLVRRTAGHRFRHHDDVALDQLFHYYARATGRAVPAPIGYTYVNVGVADEARHRLRRLLNARDSDAICLNDNPEDGRERTPDTELRAFLEAYFPLRSSAERP